MHESVQSVAMIGLGRLGAPIAACLAAGGFRVVGVDLKRETVEAINRRRPPVFEPGLEAMLGRVDDRLTATDDLAGAIRQTDASFVLVPTPSETDGSFSLDYVLAACEEIGEALRDLDRWHLVTIVSTVMPGDTSGAIQHTLERTSGKTCGEGFGLCYSPEFVALGTVIRDYLNPDMLLIGESDPRSGRTLASIYKAVVETDPPVSRMSFVNAEIAKISVNAYVTAKITFANTLAGICERVPGADVDAVTQAIGLDSRIGRKYLKGGIGYGGPCFPRDNAALAHVARAAGAIADFPETVDAVNRQQVDRMTAQALAVIPPQSKIAILGLSYKPQSDVVDESQPVMLAERLAQAGHTVRAFDPAATPANKGYTLCDTQDACLLDAHAVVLATPWPGMAEAVIEQANQKPTIIIDPWRVLIEQTMPAGTTYLPGGRHVVLGDKKTDRIAAVAPPPDDLAAAG
ncbi:UDP-glucose dehydrogenase family protein [Mucisphaera calidilacus]|uniref:UDP-glucose 6-dehydrogenase n=1 Tax=Mucisphaera calidilacus TaxID=2527982 RepID=A0A518BUY3_9BACT|nr:nucleotide sugar dehydrogenase [Mucisphaera calidilacus]QDU70795.1 GDP-mannose 6-dehydrogenase [Mucisphaera calidilacus]